MDVYKTEGHVYLQTRKNNPAKSTFKRYGLKVLHNEHLKKDKDDEDDSYDATLHPPDYPDETEIVDMKLHCDFFKDICGTSLPDDINVDMLVKASHTIKCCAGNKCQDDGNPIYYNYHCLSCYKFCHRKCSTRNVRPYDHVRSMMTHQSSLPYSGLWWVREYINSYTGSDEVEVHDVSHVLCAKCNVKSKHKICSLARDESLVKCVNQRDTYPHEKCVDCNELVHIGCSVVYPSTFDRNSFSPGDLKKGFDLSRKCLNCCFSNSKNGEECAYDKCLVSYKSIPFLQRCFLCNGLVHIECCMFLRDGVEGIDTSIECTFLCKSCSEDDSKTNGLSLQDTDKLLSSRYHWIFSKNLFSHPESLFDTFSKLNVSQSRKSKGGEMENSVSFLVDSLSSIEEPHVVLSTDLASLLVEDSSLCWRALYTFLDIVHTVSPYRNNRCIIYPRSLWDILNDADTVKSDYFATGSIVSAQSLLFIGTDRSKLSCLLYHPGDKQDVIKGSQKKKTSKQKKKGAAVKLLCFPDIKTCDVLYNDIKEDGLDVNLFEDVEMQDVLGEYHIKNESFTMMKEREQLYMFVSVAYVFLLHPNYIDFDWDNLVLPCMDNMRYIIYQAFSGQVINVFRNLYTESKDKVYMNQSYSFRSTKLEKNTELDDLFNDASDDIVGSKDEPEYSHREKCSFWKTFTDDWVTRRKGCSTDAKLKTNWKEELSQREDRKFQTKDELNSDDVPEHYGRQKLQKLVYEESNKPKTPKLPSVDNDEEEDGVTKSKTSKTKLRIVDDDEEEDGGTKSKSSKKTKSPKIPNDEKEKEEEGVTTQQTSNKSKPPKLPSVDDEPTQKKSPQTKTVTLTLTIIYSCWRQKDCK